MLMIINRHKTYNNLNSHGMKYPIKTKIPDTAFFFLPVSMKKIKNAHISIVINVYIGKKLQR